MVLDEFTVGTSGPWLGMLNNACNEKYKDIGIEFDTHHNPEFGNLNDNHIGIDLGSIISVDNQRFGPWYLTQGRIQPPSLDKVRWHRIRRSRTAFRAGFLRVS